VDLQAHRGEIHGVLGQNGAGKTTLMNVLLGLVTPDTGQILMNGAPVAIRDPLEAAARGVAMVHQHFSLIGPLTLWENVTLGEKGKVDARRSIQRATEVAERYGLDVDPRARVDDLTTGQRQRAEILKCLLRNPDVLILDEPTSVLTVAESSELFGVLRQVVRDEGRAVILISHKLDEVLYATDRVTIMRSGKVVARLDTAETDANLLAREMIGREVSLHSVGAALGHLEVPSEDEASATPVHKEVALSVRDARVVSRDGRKLLDGLSLEVHRGEIVGVAGVEGNGQKAIGDLFSSLLALDEGKVEVAGQSVATGKPGRMQEAGVGIIPEDRHACGCVLDMSVAENLVIGAVEDVCSGSFLSKKKMHALATDLVRQFEIMTSSVDAPMRSLSGGNQQRVVLARELSRDPVVLVAAQPTRGLDVGAIEYMTKRLREVAERGVGVLLISTELEEILALADRVVVIHRGRITGEMERGAVDVERLGLLMGGQKE
jgi:simple sugar transport system ATP-binding protein